jgi:hypothetical protein
MKKATYLPCDQLELNPAQSEIENFGASLHESMETIANTAAVLVRTHLASAIFCSISFMCCFPMRRSGCLHKAVDGKVLV